MKRENKNDGRRERSEHAGRSGRPNRPQSGRPRRDASQLQGGRGERAPRDERKHDGGDYCWGRNPVLSLLEESPARCLKVLLSKTMQRGMYERITERCKASGIPFGMVEAKTLDAMTDGENHQGVVATIAASELLSLQDALALLPPAPEPVLAILFDHIQDPHNLGAMIRSAEAVGAVFAAVPLRRSSLPTGTVVKTSAGASLRFPIASVGNVANAVREMQEAGLWCVGLDADASGSIYDTGIPARALLVVGAEGKGLTKTTAAACDEVLRIPIQGGAGSLNASVALGVAMFEWFRETIKNKI
ncbi:23S rRNA (guanosine(2251)-2'-O)-methyltransferase RlmB [Synergistaceae bacterium OttesenSCG-928-I11]|nr:23S rRNA (guanosine(2251)-2'-O)-methyltransferase RlmB [Synergistaceae bacterium OttesenSCG-928-I11]